MLLVHNSAHFDELVERNVLKLLVSSDIYRNCTFLSFLIRCDFTGVVNLLRGAVVAFNRNGIRSAVNNSLAEGVAVLCGHNNSRLADNNRVNAFDFAVEVCKGNACRAAVKAHFELVFNPVDVVAFCCRRGACVCKGNAPALLRAVSRVDYLL